MSAAEAQTLGLGASAYDEDTSQDNPNLGVMCDVGPVGLTFFHGRSFRTMVSGLKAGVEEGGLERQDGPTVGSEAHWSSMGPMHQLMFLSENKKYAANMVSQDRAQLEKVGKALAAIIRDK